MVLARIKQRGSILITIAAVLAILSLSTLAKMAMQDMGRKADRQTGGSKTLSNLDIALANFVAQNRRLPCPAYGTTPSTNATAGIEQRNINTGACTTATQNNGVVPWVTLGVPENAALDSWGNRITYRVHPGLTARFSNTPAPGPYNAMDMTNCYKTAGTGIAQVSAQVNASATTYLACSSAALCTSCTASCGALCTNPNNVLTNNGLPVNDGAGVWLNQPSARTGAAYVLISHGANTAGAYSTAGVLSVGTGFIGTNEGLNRNGTNLMTNSVVANSYRDSSYNNTQTPQHFDDMLSHPTISTVLTNASLGPRKP